MSLTDLSAVKAAYAPDPSDTSKDAEITRLVGVVDVYLPRVLGRILERQNFVRYFDGADWDRELPLNPGHRPVVHEPSASPDPIVVGVQENGVSLVVGTGYDPNCEVIVVNANLDKPCALVRPAARWTADVPQNVKVTYTAGPASVSADVSQLANWFVWYAVTEPTRFAKLQQSAGPVALNFSKELPIDLKLLFNSLVVWY